MSISIHEKQDVFILNSCFTLPVVSLGRSLVPSNLSAAFMTSRPRKMVKEAAWATNFINGPHIILPSCNRGYETEGHCIAFSQNENVEKEQQRREIYNTWEQIFGKS